MILLLDIGNSHTHLGLGVDGAVCRQENIPTQSWFDGQAPRLITQFVEGQKLHGTALCTVVPKAGTAAKEVLGNLFPFHVFTLTHETVTGIGIDYPRPETIGPDRLANAIAAQHIFGAPVVVVDFGTAVTFDVVDARGNYAGGIIAPGLAVMTCYLHEKTALLPLIEIREIDAVIGKNTEDAMLIGAVHGYRGLIRELLLELRTELGAPDLKVVATGGCAELLAAKISEIREVRPLLTLEGLLLAYDRRSVELHING